MFFVENERWPVVAGGRLQLVAVGGGRRRQWWPVVAGGRQQSVAVAVGGDRRRWRWPVVACGRRQWVAVAGPLPLLATIQVIQYLS